MTEVCVCVTKCDDGVCVCVCACVCVLKQTGNNSSTVNSTLETQGATAPFISPWPTRLLMFGVDSQSDQLHLPVIGTVDFCFSMTMLLQ